MLSTDVLHVPDPLWLDDSGVVRVRDTRVPLDVIVHAHHSGMEPEAIARAYDAVALPDLYAVISCYLHHRPIFDEYLQRRREEAARQQADIEARQPSLPSRAELLARRRARETDHAQAGQ